MLDRLARVRLWFAVLLLSIGGVSELSRQLAAWSEPHSRFDPAWLFYFAGALGLGVRLFFARYLAICFACAIAGVTFFYGPEPLAAFAFPLPFIALLSGRRMRAIFEESPGRFNRWAAGVDRRIALLRALFVAQSIVMGLLWASRDQLWSGAQALTVAAGVSIVGLVLQQTWGALVVAPVLVAETWLGVVSASVRAHRGDPPEWVFTTVLLAMAGISWLVLGPLLAGFVRRVRAEPELRASAR